MVGMAAGHSDAFNMPSCSCVQGAHIGCKRAGHATHQWAGEGSREITRVQQLQYSQAIVRGDARDAKVWGLHGIATWCYAWCRVPQYNSLADLKRAATPMPFTVCCHGPSDMVRCQQQHGCTPPCQVLTAVAPMLTTPGTLLYATMPVAPACEHSPLKRARAC